MKYTFKPANNLHLSFMALFYIFIVSFFDIGFLITLLDIFDFEYMLFCIILTTSPLIIHFIVRVFYPYKYMINDEYLIKYKKNKIIFKIKKSDIRYVLIKKTNIFIFIKFVLSLIIYDYSTEYLTTASIVFEKCDYLDNTIKYEFERIPLTYRNDNNLKEYIEILPFRKIIKICSAMDKEFQILNR